MNAVVPPARRWTFGLVIGAVFGVGVLVGGTLVGALGLVAVLLLARESGREAPVGGFLAGFGTAWLLLFVRVDLSCVTDCASSTDLTPWYIASVSLVVVGAILSLRAYLRSTS